MPEAVMEETPPKDIALNVCTHCTSGYIVELRVCSQAPMLWEACCYSCGFNTGPARSKADAILEWNKQNHAPTVKVIDVPVFDPNNAPDGYMAVECAVPGLRGVSEVPYRCEKCAFADSKRPGICTKPRNPENPGELAQVGCSKAYRPDKREAYFVRRS